MKRFFAGIFAAALSLAGIGGLPIGTAVPELPQATTRRGGLNGRSRNDRVTRARGGHRRQYLAGSGARKYFATPCRNCARTKYPQRCPKVTNKLTRTA